MPLGVGWMGRGVRVGAGHGDAIGKTVVGGGFRAVADRDLSGFRSAEVLSEPMHRDRADLWEGYGPRKASGCAARHDAKTASKHLAPSFFSYRAAGRARDRQARSGAQLPSAKGPRCQRQKCNTASKAPVPPLAICFRETQQYLGPVMREVPRCGKNTAAHLGGLALFSTPARI